MVKNNGKTSSKRASITQRKIIRRQHNQAYYETIRQQRREHYQIKKKNVSIMQLI